MDHRSVNALEMENEIAQGKISFFKDIETENGLLLLGIVGRVYANTNSNLFKLEFDILERFNVNIVC